MSATSPSLVVAPAAMHGAERVLTAEALDFVASLHRRFNAERLALLARRPARRAELGAHRAGAPLDFPADTATMRTEERSRFTLLCRPSSTVARNSCA